MAKVTFLNAIYSGKLDGLVFSRNKKGYYVKSWSMPLNPRSDAQSLARAAFGSASSTWHSLTDLQKAAWNNFGTNFFKSKDDDQIHPVSGINAFIAQRMAANFYNTIKRAATFTFPAGLTATFGSFSPVLVSPVSRPGGTIKEAAGDPLPLSLTGASIIASSGAATATLSFGKSIAAAPLFVDPILGLSTGFALQISTPMTQTAQFVASPHRQSVAVIGPPTISTGWTSGDKITISAASTDSPKDNYKSWITQGQVVEMAVYLITSDGQTSKLGSKRITVG